MRRCLIPCALLLASCGRAEPPPALSPAAALAHPVPVVDPALYRTCAGHAGPVPELMADLVAAISAEIDCRAQLAAQLDALAETHGVAR